jgi:hypothetical protein
MTVMMMMMMIMMMMMTTMMMTAAAATMAICLLGKLIFLRLCLTKNSSTYQMTMCRPYTVYRLEA